jgi:N-acetylglucosamine repressor
VRKIDTRSFTRATRATPRVINRQIALNLVREHQPISRAELARRMHIGRRMVTELVNELLGDAVIYEGENGAAQRGRKPKMLYLRTRDRLVVAVDVHYSRTYLMLGDLDGNQLALETLATPLDPAELVQELSGRITRLLRTHHGSGRCEGIGMALPGMVDTVQGTVVNSPQLGWFDVPIRDPLAEATGLPVFVDKAAIACAQAQLWLGRRGAAALDNFVYITVAGGVGVGVVMNGQVVRGHRHKGGEFGHIAIHPEGPPCLCGARGCLEAYTSDTATLSRYLGHEPAPAEMRPVVLQAALTMTELITRARTGDARAVAALTETGRCLGLGMAMIANALDPARIFIGGEITAAWDLIAPEVQSALSERALTKTAIPIIPEQAGGYPRLRGAIALVTAPLFAAPTIA